LIWESKYWRDDLHRRAQALRNKQKQHRWFDASFGRLEQTIMLAFYSIRKLAEAKKIPDSQFQQSVELLFYSAIGKPVTLLNWHNLDELYKVQEPSGLVKPLSFVANQIIHSFVFVPILTPSRTLDGIAFNSDKTRQSGVFCIKIDEIIRILNSVSGSYVGKATIFRSTESGQLKIVTEE